MANLDFATWLAAGSYGGLTCSLLVAVAIAGYALRLRRGTGRQLARAMLVLLSAGCLMFAPIWWTQNRFGLLGPTLSPVEVAFWLAWAALIGFGVPLGAATVYVALAAAQPPTGKVAVPAHLRAPQHTLAGAPFPVELSDPRRRIEPLGAGRAWGRLVPLDGPPARPPLLLTRQVTLLGREADCDIIISGQLTSRHHAELHWDRGHVELVERGSMNGSRVNGQGIIGRAPLRAGDIVELGERRFRFEPLGSQPNLAAGPVRFAADEATHKLPGVGRVGPATIPATPPLRLVLCDAAPPGQFWDLNTGVVEVGRDGTRQICLPDNSVSRLHAQIVRQATGFYLHDLTSQNGTLVNGILLEAPTCLRPGDLIQFGSVRLRCESLPRPAFVAPTAAGNGFAPPTSSADQADAQADRATPPSLARASAAGPAPARTPTSPPSALTRLGPNPDARERPHLGPPRLLPTDPPARQG